MIKAEWVCSFIKGEMEFFRSVISSYVWKFNEISFSLAMKIIFVTVLQRIKQDFVLNDSTLQWKKIILKLNWFDGKIRNSNNNCCIFWRKKIKSSQHLSFPNSSGPLTYWFLDFTVILFMCATASRIKLKIS